MPVVKLKTGVKINGAHFYREMTRIIDCFRATAPVFSDDVLWITSANDSTHMQGSLHYMNRAFDIRINNILGGIEEAKKWVIRAQLALGDNYDVILEKDHVHVEFQPSAFEV